MLEMTQPLESEITHARTHTLGWVRVILLCHRIAMALRRGPVGANSRQRRVMKTTATKIFSAEGIGFAGRNPHCLALFTALKQEANAEVGMWPFLGTSLPGQHRHDLLSHSAPLLRSGDTPHSSSVSSPKWVMANDQHGVFMLP